MATNMYLTEEERNHFMRLLRQPDNITFAAMLCLSLLQITLATTVDSFSLGFFLKIIFFGAPISHGLYVLNLEFSNNLCFGHELLDRVSAIISNFAAGIPYAELIRYFDAEHRAFYDSTLYRDPEKPSDLEIKLVQGSGIKLMYLCFYPLIYGYRLLSRHSIAFTRFLLWNMVCQSLFNLYVWYYYGFYFLSYLICSAYVGMCPLHPFSTHLLMQHQKLDPQLKVAITYSYYGVVNLFTFNMGYHRERHENPKVPWSKLPLVRQLYYYAEYPDNPHNSMTRYRFQTKETGTRSYYTSTLQAVHDFIYNPDIGLQ
jgi:sphingolipid delta-4 desaturase